MKQFNLRPLGWALQHRASPQSEMPESAKAVSESVYENLNFQQQGPVIPPGTSDVPRHLAGPRAESRRITGHVLAS